MTAQICKHITVYLKECENLLLVLSIHITLLKQQEVWHKSIAWSNMPGIQKEGSLSGCASEHAGQLP